MDISLLGKQIVGTLAFSAIGLVLFGLAFWVMDKLTPFSIRKEIEDDHNTALAVIMGAVILGISLIIMGALMG